MRKLAFALTMLSTSASAADFRALDIGQSCASAREWEVARGSTPMPGRAGAGADVYAFTGREFDRNLYFSYFCMHGDLFTGNYSFPIESLEQAVDSYRDVHGLLLSRYGDPFVDNSPWNRDSDKRSIATDSSKYMTNWRTPRVSATLSIMPNQPTEKSGWRVFLVIAPVLSKAKSPPSS
jgi:hypothetical protein